MFIEINNLKKSFGSDSNRVEVLRGVDFSIEKGDICVLLGPSGSGKSTLLNIIGGIDDADAGYISIGGERMADMNEKKLTAYRRKHLGYVFQMYNLIPNLTVRENICLPQIIARKPVAQMEAKSENLCSLFGINKIMDKYPAEISGGEKQRTAVARALINNPYIILADEPTGNLDSRSCKAVIDAFLQAKEQIGATIFMVTHDSYAASFCDRVIVLKDGEIHQEVKRTGTRREFMDELLDILRELGGDEDNE